MRKSFLCTLLLVIWVLPFIANAAQPEKDYVAFLQKDNSGKTLYVAETDGTTHLVATGKDINIFFSENNLLYFSEHRLFKYDLKSKQPTVLANFQEDEIMVQALPGDAGQALVAAEDSYSINWYIVDLNEGGMRRITDPSRAQRNGSGSSADQLSPNSLGKASIESSMNSFRYNLILQEKRNNGFVNVWNLPKDMTILPEFPIWSPDSKWVAFFGKPDDDAQSYYGLYIVNLATRKMLLVQEKVFAKTFIEGLHMDGYRPDWSPDGKSMIFTYQPYGSPTQNVVMKYDVQNAKKEILTLEKGFHKYPMFSPSGKFILFISDHEGQDQIYLTEDGKNVKRLSPGNGSTEWAYWFEPSLKN